MDKKQVLKQAAYDVFSKKGYKATAISEVAKQAGMAVGSFYNYYASKEEIFLDVYIDENNRIRQVIMNDIDWKGDVVELIGQLFGQSRSLVSSNKILAEWYNPAISNELHSYYSSEEVKSIPSVFNRNFYQSYDEGRIFSRKNSRGFRSLSSFLLYRYEYYRKRCTQR